MKKYLDRLDKMILSHLIKDARTPFLEISRQAGVSGAVVHQRVKKLEQAGILKGSQIIIDNDIIGYGTCAFVGVVLNDLMKYQSVVDAIKEMPEIVECHAVTGRYALLLKLYARNNKDLRDFVIGRLSQVPGIQATETFQISLEEVFNRQIETFDEEVDMGD
jgi:Transcriptional regulators